MVASNGSPKRRKVTGVQLFELGLVVGTSGSTAVLRKHDLHPFILIARHASGDWGEVGAEDAAANDDALANGGRLMSVYKFGKGDADDDDVLWVITEADRSTTTILVPSEY